MVRRKYPLFMVWPSGQSIGLVKGAGFVDNVEVKLGKKEGPASLAMGKFLFGSKVGKIVMIRPNFERNWMSFKEMLVCFEGTDDGQEFFIMDVVV